MKEKNINTNKKFTKGFTLIELLVVVLIIGILAAIALPQYRHAVIKSRYAAMKDMVRSIAQMERDYYLIHDEYTQKFSDLIIDLNCLNGSSGRSCAIKNKMTIYITDWQVYGILSTNKAELYFASYYDSSNIYCQAYKNNIQPSDFEYKFCQNETGKTTPWIYPNNKSYVAFKYN